MKDYKLVNASEAEATRWYGDVTIEVDGKEYLIGVEVDAISGETILFGDVIDTLELDIDYEELERVAEMAVLHSLQHGLEEKAGL